MEVHTNVAESDIGRLQTGMRVTFTVDAYPGEPFRGSIRDIRNAPQVVQNVVTYDAVIDVANDDLKLKPGMTATVSVVTDRRRDVLSRAERGAALPARRRARRQRPVRGDGKSGAQRARASAQGGGASGQSAAQPRKARRRAAMTVATPVVVKRTVYVLIDGKPVAREVTTGITDGRVTEITGGDLKEGEAVIVAVAGQNAQGQRGGSSSAAPDSLATTWRSSNCATSARSTSPVTRNSPRCTT